MIRKKHEEEGLARLAAWAVRNRARALRDEVTRPWRRGRRAPEAEVGRWIGFGLAMSTLVVGVGLAVIASLSED